MHNVTFHVDFLSPDDEGQGFAELHVELPFVPTTDIEFDPPVWHAPRKPYSVSYNLKDSSFYVHLGADKLDSKKYVPAHVKMYMDHEWDAKGV